MLNEATKATNNTLDEPKTVKKIKTNLDRILAMNSAEEFAKFLVVENPNCLYCEFFVGYRCQPDRSDYSDTEKCIEGKRRWLLQPMEEAQ